MAKRIVRKYGKKDYLNADDCIKIKNRSQSKSLSKSPKKWYLSPVSSETANPPIPSIQLTVQSILTTCLSPNNSLIGYVRSPKRRLDASRIQPGGHQHLHLQNGITHRSFRLPINAVNWRLGARYDPQTFQRYLTPLRINCQPVGLQESLKLVLKARISPSEHLLHETESPKRMRDDRTFPYHPQRPGQLPRYRPSGKLPLTIPANFLQQRLGNTWRTLQNQQRNTPVTQRGSQLWSL